MRDYSRSKIAMAACITVATHLSSEEALLAFGADPVGETFPWSSPEVQETWDSAVAVAAPAGADVAVEYNGWHGAHPGVLAPLSRAGRAASLYWNVDSDMKLSVAQDGRLQCAFDPAAPARRWGEDPAAVDPLIADLDFAAGAWVAHGMTLVERFTGVRVTPEMVASMEAGTPPVPSPTSRNSRRSRRRWPPAPRAGCLRPSPTIPSGDARRPGTFASTVPAAVTGPGRDPVRR